MSMSRTGPLFFWQVEQGEWYETLWGRDHVDRGLRRCKYHPEALTGYLDPSEEGEGPSLWTHDLELESSSDL